MLTSNDIATLFIGLYTRRGLLSRTGLARTRLPPRARRGIGSVQRYVEGLHCRGAPAGTCEGQPQDLVTPRDEVLVCR
jgi:hypothetical protein